MSTSRTRKRPSTRRFDHCVAKPRGLLHPRVQQVGPQHFGIVCFDCAKLLATQWAAQGKDPRHTRVKVGLRFCRIAFQMVAGRQVFRHPAIQGRHYILDKRTAFHHAHDSGMVAVLRDLQAAIAQVPPREHAADPLWHS